MTGFASGKLRHKVEILAPSNEQDQDTGEIIPGWDVVASVWADIAPLSGREFLASGAEQSEVTGKITIRYRSGLDAAMQIRHRSTLYSIKAILPDAESGIELLTLMVGAGVVVD